MHRFARKHGVRVHGMSEVCLRALQTHHWPGNVRELQNVIERAVILCGDVPLLEPEFLCLSQPPPKTVVSVAAPAALPPPAAENRFVSIAELEKRHILAALEHCGNNRTQAAKLLDISIRTLRNKLHEYNGSNGRAVEPLEEEDDVPAI